MDAPPKSKYYVPSDKFLDRSVDYVMKRLPIPFGCLMILGWMILFVLFLPLHLYCRHRNWLWFAKTLGQQGRVMVWDEFLQRMPGTGGTIIIEKGIQRAGRYWWTQDEVRKSSPIAPPLRGEMNCIKYGGSDYHPFARWCYENYLNPIDGRAVLVWPIEADYETFPFEPEFDIQMRDRFPNQDVIVLPFYDVRYA